MANVIRVTREYFLPDADLKRALGLPARTIILNVERKTGAIRGSEGAIALFGSIVLVYDPTEPLKETPNGK